MDLNYKTTLVAAKKQNTKTPRRLYFMRYVHNVCLNDVDVQMKCRQLSRAPVVSVEKTNKASCAPAPVKRITAYTQTDW